MKSSIRNGGACLTGVGVFFLCVALTAEAEIQLGTAAVDITPAPGTPLAGYYYERAATGVHDPLYAKAMVLSDGQTRVALVSLDVISTSRFFVEEARRRIAGQSHLPGQQVMISATHAHTGPVLARTSKRYDDLGGHRSLAQQFTDELPARIAQAVAAAQEALKPVQVFHGAGQEKNLGFNRRYFMRDGSVGWNPGKLNTNILHAAGPMDEEAPVVYFADHDQRPVAAYANFAIHLDNIGGLQISADMPGVLTRLLGEAKGSNFFTLYTTGCAGDINHLNVHLPRRQSGFEEAARLGTLLAANLLRTLDGELRAVPTNATLRVRTELVKLPLPKTSDAEVEWARGITSKDRGSNGTNRPQFMDLVRAYRLIDVHERKGAPQEVEVQVIALGDEIAWVSLPGEIFVELGMTIKAGSPFRRTIIAELANGSIGYIPNRVAYPQGNYEVESARCAEGSGEILVDTALRLLRESYRKAK